MESARGEAASPTDGWLWTPTPRLEPGWTGWALTTALALWIVDAESIPGGNLGHLFFALPIAALLCIAWAARLVLALVAHVRKGRSIAWRRFAVQPALAILLFLAVSTSAPLAARFDLSRGAMDGTAHAVMAGSRDPAKIHAIGLFSVQRAERIPGGFRFLVSSTGFLDPAGFAYSPGGPPAVLGEDQYEHYRGAWYSWSESW